MITTPVSDPEPDPPRRLRVLADVDFYPPTQLGGSEVALHAVLAWLAARGHEVRVVVKRQRTPRRAVIDGVLRESVSLRARKAAWDWCDIAITQHGATPQACRFAAQHSKPLAFYSHNAGQVDLYHESLPATALAIFNNDAETAPWPTSVVVHPPVWPDQYRTTPGEHTTLVNLSDLKGGPVLWDLAARHPHRPFLAVVGAWQAPGDRQIIPPTVPDNVTVQPTTPAMRDHVYRRTRVLLMPSRLETFGRVGVEAACSGIPTVAHPTPGLAAALGDAAIWVDRDDPDGWAAALDRLDDPDEWTRLSRLATTRADELAARSTSELTALEEALCAA